MTGIDPLRMVTNATIGFFIGELVEQRLLRRDLDRLLAAEEGKFKQETILSKYWDTAEHVLSASTGGITTGAMNTAGASYFEAFRLGLIDGLSMYIGLQAGRLFSRNRIGKSNISKNKLDDFHTAIEAYRRVGIEWKTHKPEEYFRERVERSAENILAELPRTDVYNFLVERIIQTEKEILKAHNYRVALMRGEEGLVEATMMEGGESETGALIIPHGKLLYQQRIVPRAGLFTLQDRETEEWDGKVFEIVQTARVYKPWDKVILVTGPGDVDLNRKIDVGVASFQNYLQERAA